MKKIILINPTQVNNEVPVESNIPSLGLCYISTVLKENGYKNIIGIDLQKDPEKKFLNDFKGADIAGIHTTSKLFVDTKELCKRIKKINNYIVIVVGGPRATLTPKEVISVKEIDIVVQGEGEYAFTEIIQAIDNNQSFSKIKGIWYKDKGKIKRTKSREWLKNLDQLPFPDRELFDANRYKTYILYLDRKGKIIRQTRVTTSEQGLDALFRGLRSRIKVVIESCGIWLNIYKSLEQRGYKVCLANPLKLKAIASAKIKNDKVDSETLAQLLRANLIPETYIPTKKVREFRDIVRHRASLVKLRKTVKNKVHAILRSGGIKHTYNNLFAQRARSFLENLKDEKITSLLVIFDSLSKEIKGYDNKIKQKCMMNNEANLLKTIPGISDLSALILLSEIGDIKRFSTPRQLCSYAGLVPSQSQSGDKDYRGHITKQGSKWIRWILIQCANITIQYPGRIQLYFYKLKKRKHRNLAITATARKMLYYIWFILTNQEPYRDVYARGLGTSNKT